MEITVAFDIGNVLCHFDIYRFTEKLSKVVGITDHDAYFLLVRLQALQDIGVTSVATELESQYRLKGEEIMELVDAWNSTVYPNDSMMRFLENLKTENTKIALLSNMGPEHLGYLKKTVPDLFQDTIHHISCEVGARKPTKLFFQSFIMDNDIFKGCVYIDDIEENLRAGKKYSFKSYQFNLENHMKLTLAQQKTELDRLKNMIINMHPNQTRNSKVYSGEFG